MVKSTVSLKPFLWRLTVWLLRYFFFFASFWKSPRVQGNECSRMFVWQGKVSSSSSDPPGLDDEPEKLKEDHRSRTEQDDCDQKATTSGCRKDPKSSQVCNDDDAFVFPPGNCTGDSNLAAPAHDKVTNMKSFSSNSMMGLCLCVAHVFLQVFGIGSVPSCVQLLMCS